MSRTVSSWRDRAGHHGLAALTGLLLVLLCGTAADAAPGTYKARRFDVVARAINGDLDVSESITFEFQSGTFTNVWRDLLSSRTDGIEVLGVEMDGAPLTQGDGPGHFTVSGRSRLRVTWRFAETPASVHRFDLHYVARGVAYRENGSDVLRWRALPTEHRYRIDASRIELEPAGARVMPPETHRVGAAAVHPSNEAVSVDASDIQSNGWITMELHYAPGTLTTTQPGWYAHDAATRALAPKWAMGGAAMFVGALLLMLFARQGYPAPEFFPGETTVTEPPQPLPVALASVLMAKGRLAGYQAIATILDLADRGVLTVREERGFLNLKTYRLSQVPGAHDLEPHEAEALSIAFAGKGDDVPMSRARDRVGRANRRFNNAVNADLTALGLIDLERKTVRDRLVKLSIGMVLVAAMSSVAIGPLIPSYGPWPFLLALGLGVAGIIGFILAAATTPLSDAGLVEAARWRGFRHYLKTLASSRDSRAQGVPSRWIVYAIGGGLGYYWSRFLRRNPMSVPPWFIAADGDSGAAFASFIGSHSASASAGGAGGGGAAGGGGSGAG